MRLLTTGVSGQVAQSLKETGAELGVDIACLGRPDFDLFEPGGVRNAIEALPRPDAIISAAAYTAVDRAESEPDLAMAANGESAGEVAKAAASLGVPLLHLSTDYVFDGLKSGAYVETDQTGPTGVYGRSKLEGERLAALYASNSVILRTAWVYSPFGANFVKTMLRLAENGTGVRVVADQTGAPTYAPDIARALIGVAGRMIADPDPALRGIFHMTGAGRASWADFAQEIFTGLAARGGPDIAVSPIQTSDYPTPARRPANSLLCCEKLARLYQIALPDWRLSLSTCLDRLVGPVRPGKEENRA